MQIQNLKKAGEIVTVLNRERFNPLNTSWTRNGSSGPGPGPLKQYPRMVNCPARGDPWAMKMWVFLGSLHAKEPPKIESGQKFILEPEIWPGVQS